MWHTGLSGLSYYYLRPWWSLGQAAAGSHVWAHESIAARVSVEVRGPCCRQRSHGSLGFGPQLVPLLVSESRTDLNALYCTMGQWCCPGPSCCHVWFHDSIAARVWAGICDCCCSGGPCGCPGSGQSPETMSRAHAAAEPCRSRWPVLPPGAWWHPGQGCC